MRGEGPGVLWLQLGVGVSCWSPGAVETGGHMSELQNPQCPPVLGQRLHLGCVFPGPWLPCVCLKSGAEALAA